MKQFKGIQKGFLLQSSSFVEENNLVKTDNDNRTISGFSGGNHTWMNCKLYLTNTLQQLFKEQPDHMLEIISKYYRAWGAIGARMKLNFLTVFNLLILFN